MGATKQTAHTPTPWEACGNLVRTARTDVDPSGLLVCDCPANVGNRIEDAAFIVRACNAHDDLVAALRKAEFTLQTLTSRTARERDACVVEIRAALAKAGAA